MASSAPSEILESHDTGYYATLELQYGCSKADVASQFTKLAAAINPDGNIKDSATATQFQKLLTAYEVLNDDNARSGYDRILQYRYYLEQPSSVDPARALPPHLVFCIQKINENKVVQTRLLKLDFVREEFTNWDKDVLRTTHKFSDIKGLQGDVAGKPNEWIITFKTYPRPYHYRSATVREKVMLCAIVRGLLANKLTVTRDDIELPLKSDLRGWVQQKGGSGLFAKRFVLVGPSNLLVFRNSRCTNMTVCLNLVPGEVKLTFGDNLAFSLIAKEQAVTIKLDSQEQFSEWASHLSDLLEKPDDAAKLRRSRANSSMPFTGDDIRHHKPASEYNSESKDEEALSMPTGQISINLDDLDLGDIPQTVKSGLQAQLMLDGGDAQQTLSRIEYAINLKKRELEDLNNMRKLLKKQLGMVTSNVFQKVSVRIGTFFSKEPEENFL